jgi:threonine dehydratase
MAIKLADIETAHRQLTGAVLRTPMLPAPKLSALTGAEVYVKYENLQVTIRSRIAAPSSSSPRSARTSAGAA